MVDTKAVVGISKAKGSSSENSASFDWPRVRSATSRPCTASVTSVAGMPIALAPTAVPSNTSCRPEPARVTDAVPKSPRTARNCELFQGQGSARSKIRSPASEKACFPRRGSSAPGGHAAQERDRPFHAMPASDQHRAFAHDEARHVVIHRDQQRATGKELPQGRTEAHATTAGLSLRTTLSPGSRTTLSAEFSRMPGRSQSPSGRTMT